MGKFDDEFNSAFGSDFDDDDDNDLLFGEHTEDTDGVIEEEDDDYSGFDTGTNPPGNQPDDNEEDEETVAKKKSFKKTAIMMAGIAIFLLIVVALLINLVGRAQANKAQEQTNAPAQQTTVASTEIVDLGGKRGKDKDKETPKETAQQPTEVQTQTVEVVKDPYDWIEVDLSTTDLTFGEPIESLFTITDIKTYARFSGSGKDTQTKAVVMGNISGLVGTYTLEIPADKAVKLTTGMSFSITYQLKQMDGYKLVGEIQY